MTSVFQLVLSLIYESGNFYYKILSVYCTTTSNINWRNSIDKIINACLRLTWNEFGHIFLCFLCFLPSRFLACTWNNETDAIFYYTKEHSAPTITKRVIVLFCQKSRCAIIEPYAIFKPSPLCIAARNLQK